MNEQESKIIEEKMTDTKTEDLFDTEEIEIEEMAIDGICGVY